MDRLAGLIANAPNTRSSNDDDFADRLSSRYSVVLLVVFAILVSMNQYVRNPITCWAPVHFTGAHNRFTTSYCWVKNTYYLPWEHEMPRQNEPEKRQMIPYYQWIPFILLMQACLFYFPTVVWHGLNSNAGVDADSILATANTFSRIDKADSRDRTLMLLTNQIDRFLLSRQDGDRCGCDVKSMLSTLLCRMCGRRLGSYLLIIYLFSKVCYIGNVVGQLFLLNAVLSTRYNTFGVDLLRNAYTHHDWTEDSYVAFPRVTFCDFQIRGQDMANVQTYTVQCVLPINLYNEKIFAFLWFWMVFVAAVSVLSFFVWLLRAVATRDRVKFVENHLRLGSRLGSGLSGVVQDGELMRKFTKEYLRQDGSLLLRLVAHNTDNITTTEVICGLWDQWKEKNVKFAPPVVTNDLPNHDKRSGLYPDPADFETMELKKFTDS